MSAAEKAAEVLAAHLHLVSWHGRHDCCKTCGSQGRNVRVDSTGDHARHLTEALAAAGLLAEPTDQDQRKPDGAWWQEFLATCPDYMDTPTWIHGASSAVLALFPEAPDPSP